MNISNVLNGTPSARRAVRPWPAPSMGAGFTPGRALGSRGGSRRRRLGSPGKSRRWGAAAQARCLSVGTHGAGRRRSAVPPHPPPGGPRRHAPQLTVLAEPPAASRAGRSCRRESSQSRARPTATSLRSDPGRPLTRASPARTAPARRTGKGRKAALRIRLFALSDIFEPALTWVFYRAQDDPGDRVYTRQPSR